MATFITLNGIAPKAPHTMNASKNSLIFASKLCDANDTHRITPNTTFYTRHAIYKRVCGECVLAKNLVNLLTPKMASRWERYKEQNPDTVALYAASKK